MPQMRTYIKKDLAQLSYTHEEIGLNLIYNQAFPAFGTPAESGSFRELEARATKVRAKTISDKNSVAKRIGISDTPRYYHNKPISLGFELNEADLKDFANRGYLSKNAMIDEYQKTISTVLKKEKEAQLYAAVTTNSNFETSSYYANAATAWSTTGTADPTADIQAGKLVVPEINAIAMSWTAYQYAIQCANVLGATTVAGTRRDASLQPTPNVDHLKNLWALDYVFVSKGNHITDSSDPSDETDAEIWGDSALLFHHTPSNSPNSPAWIKHLYWAREGAVDEGWRTVYDFGPLVGGEGMHYWDTWNYFEFMIHEKSFAYRIDNLY